MEAFRSGGVSHVQMDLSDEHLMALIQTHDSRALEHLHERYAKLVKSIAMQVLHNDAESDDMVQDIFIEIWNRAGSYIPGKGKPLGWMITLSRRRSIDRLRRREAYQRVGDRFIQEMQTDSEIWKTHVEEDCACNEMRGHLIRVLATLPIAQRQAIELAYFKGLSQREIAAHTGTPLGTIKTRLELAFKKLAVELRGFEDLL